MRIGFADEFHVAGMGQPHETVQNVGGAFFKLVKNRAADGKTDLEFALVLADEIEQEHVHGQVSVFAHSAQDVAVDVSVFVEMVFAEIKHGIGA